jgi:hypothetical protein
VQPRDSDGGTGGGKSTNWMSGCVWIGACRDDRERILLLRSERQMRNGGVVRFDATLVDEQSSSMLGIGPHQRGPAPPPLPAQIFSCPVRPVRSSWDCALSLDSTLHGLRAVPPRASMDRGRQGPRRRSRCAGYIPWRTARGAGQAQGHGSGTFCHLQTCRLQSFAAQTALRPELDRAVTVTSYPPRSSRLIRGCLLRLLQLPFTLPAPFFFPSSFLCACFQYPNISISHNIPTLRKLAARKLQLME